MKLVFHIFIFALVSFASAHRDGSSKLGSQYEHYDTCLTESDLSADDVFTVDNLIHDNHKSASQEKLHKIGCLIQCVLQKSGLMNEAEYDEEKIREDYIKETKVQPGDKMVEGLDNCMNETKDLTDKCQKSLNLVECVVKAEERLSTSNESKGE